MSELTVNGIIVHGCEAVYSPQDNSGGGPSGLGPRTLARLTKGIEFYELAYSQQEEPPLLVMAGAGTFRAPIPDTGLVVSECMAQYAVDQGVSREYVTEVPSLCSIGDAVLGIKRVLERTSSQEVTNIIAVSGSTHGERLQYIYNVLTGAAVRSEANRVSVRVATVAEAQTPQRWLQELVGRHVARMILGDMPIDDSDFSKRIDRAYSRLQDQVPHYDSTRQLTMNQFYYQLCRSMLRGTRSRRRNTSPQYG